MVRQNSNRLKDLRKSLVDNCISQVITGEIAMTYDGIIGIGQKLLYNIPQDMERFVENTTGKIVVMGRKTFESMGSVPLKNRFNIVISKTLYPEYKKYDELNAELFVCANITYAIKFIGGMMSWSNRQMCIIGGAEIYKMFENYIDEWHVTVFENENEQTILDRLGEDIRPEIIRFKPLLQLMNDNNLTVHNMDRMNPNNVRICFADLYRTIEEDMQ